MNIAPADTLSFVAGRDPLLARAGWCLQASLQHHSNNDPSGSHSSPHTNRQNRLRCPSPLGLVVKASASNLRHTSSADFVSVSVVAGSQQSSSDPPIPDEIHGNNHEHGDPLSPTSPTTLSDLANIPGLHSTFIRRSSSSRGAPSVGMILSASHSSHYHTTSLTSKLGAVHILTIGCLNLRGFNITFIQF